MMESQMTKAEGLLRPNISAPWEFPHQSITTAEDIYYCFRLFLGRTPHLEEWKGHVAQAGRDVDSVVGAYANSLEFSKRMVALQNSKVDSPVSLIDLKDFSLYVQESDFDVGAHLKKDGRYEPHVTSVVRNRVKAGMHVLDIGANIGYYTMLSASLVGPHGSVMAFDPNPTNAKLIEASRRANSYNNVCIVQAAAGRGVGLLVLNTSYSNGTTAKVSDDLRTLLNSVTVPSLRIDDLIAKEQRIDFVKIDVEGAEYNALLGATDMIKRCHPIIASEFSPGLLAGISGITGAEYLEFLLAFGYKISIVETDGQLTESRRDVQKVMDAYERSGVDHIDILMD
jgi:FkbM family methyltransferase